MNDSENKKNMEELADEALDKVSGGINLGDRFAARRDQMVESSWEHDHFGMCTLCWVTAGRKYTLYYPEPLGPTVTTCCDFCAEKFRQTYGPGTAVRVDD